MRSVGRPNIEEAIAQIRKLSTAPDFRQRQTFLAICAGALAPAPGEDHLDQQLFAQEFMPLLLMLESDPVANVRIALAQAINRCFQQCRESDSRIAAMPLHSGYRPRLGRECSRFFASLAPIDSSDEAKYSPSPWGSCTTLCGATVDPW